MIYNFSLTREDLIAIVLCLRETNIINIKDSDELLDLKRLVPGVISILLIQCFGEYNAELIWLYAVDSDKNQFESIDELYKYLSDPYSSIVQKDSALTLKQLKSLFSDEEMFKYFSKIVTKHESNNT